MTVKERLHRLVDLLPERETSVAERLLEALYSPPDPLLRTLANAPLDDEPETEAERAAVAEARADVAAGRVFTLDEVRRDLGL